MASLTTARPPIVTKLPPTPPPSTHPSPPLEGLTTALLSPSALHTSPYLEPLTHLINAAFAGSHTIGSIEHLPKDIIRLDTSRQLVDEVGQDGFTIVVFTSDASADGAINGNGAKTKRPIATASAKPWKENAGDSGIGSETVRLFKRKSPPTSSSHDSRDETQKWEILIMAVDLAHRSRGIATTLIHAVVREIKYKILTSAPSSNENENENEQEQKVLLMLTTMKEKNEAYYLRRGFRTTSERVFKKGEMGSRDGFCVVEMEGVF